MLVAWVRSVLGAVAVEGNVVVPGLQAGGEDTEVSYEQCSPDDDEELPGMSLETAVAGDASACCAIGDPMSQMC